MLKSAVGRGEALAVLERLAGLWLRKEGSAAQGFALQKCLVKGWAKDTNFPVFFGRGGKADDAASGVSGVFFP